MVPGNFFIPKIKLKTALDLINFSLINLSIISSCFCSKGMTNKIFSSDIEVGEVR